MAIHPHLVLAKIERLLGLRYLPHQWSDLLRLLKPAAQELHFENVDLCLSWLEHGTQSEEEVSCLAKHLTIGESYFFREIAVFSMLRDVVLPEILRRKSETGDSLLRVWSAGCSTGEEVYTIAISIASLLREDSGMRVQILGTDVNPVAVERAQRGVYRDWSFRDMGSDLIDTWFTVDEEKRYTVSDRLRSMVEFKLLNLVEVSKYPSGMDIIFCRNVLMYFTRPAVQEMVSGFKYALRPDGWMVPSQTETTLINQPGLEGVRFGDVTLFRHQQPEPGLFRTKPSTAIEESGLESPEPQIRSLRFSFDDILPPTVLERSLHAKTVSNLQEEMRDLLLPDIPQVDSRASFDELIHAEATDHGATDRVETEAGAESWTADRARELADAGRLEEARVVAEHAVAADKMQPFNHFILATVLRELGETNRALQSFDLALYLDSKYIPAHFGIGSLYRFLGKPEKSSRHLKIALALLEAIPDQNSILAWSDMTAKNLVSIIRSIEAGEL